MTITKHDIFFFMFIFFSVGCLTAITGEIILPLYCIMALGLVYIIDMQRRVIGSYVEQRGNDVAAMAEPPESFVYHGDGKLYKRTDTKQSRAKPCLEHEGEKIVSKEYADRVRKMAAATGVAAGKVHDEVIVGIVGGYADGGLVDDGVASLEIREYRAWWKCESCGSMYESIPSKAHEHCCASGVTVNCNGGE